MLENVMKLPSPSWLAGRRRVLCWRGWMVPCKVRGVSGSAARGGRREPVRCLCFFVCCGGPWQLFTPQQAAGERQGLWTSSSFRGRAGGPVDSVWGCVWFSPGEAPPSTVAGVENSSGWECLLNKVKNPSERVRVQHSNFALRGQGLLIIIPQPPHFLFPSLPSHP